MKKEKRTGNRAVLEVAGRDQQDKRLVLDFDRGRCVWNLTKAETELWKEPADPLLDVIAGVVSEENPKWDGTASELLQLLPGTDLKPDVLTRKLNILMPTLLADYEILYKNDRKSSGRIIRLELVKAQK